MILATDPDREGEAISWHVLEQFKNTKLLKGVDVERVVFNEVTKTAILAAMDNPRQLDAELIDAYRRAEPLIILLAFQSHQFYGVSYLDQNLQAVFNRLRCG